MSDLSSGYSTALKGERKTLRGSGVASMTLSDPDYDAPSLYDESEWDHIQPRSPYYAMPSIEPVLATSLQFIVCEAATTTHKGLAPDRQIIWPQARGDGAFDSCDDPEVRRYYKLPVVCGVACNCKAETK